MRNRRVHVFVSGIVQGVFFRYGTRMKAEELKVKGWIRNCSGGSVEAVFEGDSDNIDKMIAYCHRGPDGAVVENVDVKEEAYQGGLGSFFVR